MAISLNTLRAQFTQTATKVGNFYYNNRWAMPATLVGGFLALTLGVTAAYKIWGPRDVELCSEDGPGSLSYGEVFEGADDRPICTVESYDLYARESDDPDMRYEDYDRARSYEEGNEGRQLRYVFRERHGLIIVDGNVPENVHIYNPSGRVEVNGDVGMNARVSADLPYETKRESYVTMCSDGEGNSYPCTRYRTVFDRFTYDNDHQPAVLVRGDLHWAASLRSSPGGIMVEGEGCENNLHASRRPAYVQGLRNCIND